MLGETWASFSTGLIWLYYWDNTVLNILAIAHYYRISLLWLWTLTIPVWTLVTCPTCFFLVVLSLGEVVFPHTHADQYSDEDLGGSPLPSSRLFFVPLSPLWYFALGTLAALISLNNQISLLKLGFSTMLWFSPPSIVSWEVIGLTFLFTLSEISALCCLFPDVSKHFTHFVHFF